MSQLVQENEERFRALCSAVFEATVFSRNGIVVDIDGPFLERLGYETEELIGRSALSLVAAEALSFTHDQMELESATTYESILLTKHNQKVPIEIVSIQSYLDGRPTRFSGIRDLSERRRKEKEQRRLQEHVERAQRLDSLGVLSGGIAHDFNNLLSSIILSTERLIGQSLGGKGAGDT
jgi:PAS domain S-box-containing protein